MNKYFIISVLFLIACCAYLVTSNISITKQRDEYKSNQEVLLSDVEFYRINDSLNVAHNGVLNMSIEGLKRYREDDAKLIRKLKGDARDLSQLTSVQAEMIANFKGSVRDSIVYVDSIISHTIKCIDVRNSWYSINGCIKGDSIEGVMTNRESLKVVERIRYKRFLGFLWKTKKIKYRKIDVLSLNPHTRIDSVESIIIEE